MVASRAGACTFGMTFSRRKKAAETWLEVSRRPVTLNTPQKLTARPRHLVFVAVIPCLSRGVIDAAAGSSFPFAEPRCEGRVAYHQQDPHHDEEPNSARVLLGGRHFRLRQRHLQECHRALLRGWDHAGILFRLNEPTNSFLFTNEFLEETIFAQHFQRTRPAWYQLFGRTCLSWLC